jgi:hypothetical protein
LWWKIDNRERLPDPQRSDYAPFVSLKKAEICAKIKYGIQPEGYKGR